MEICWVTAVGLIVSQSRDCCSSCNVGGKIREGGEDDNKGMVSDVEGVRSLGGREMLSSMRNEICVFVAVVVVVVVVVALMVAVRVVVLVIVVKVLRELCIGVADVVGVFCIGVVEVECTGVVGIMVLFGVFVEEVLEGVELVVECFVRLVLQCANGRGYF